jgi:hypothetical protein
MKTKPLAKFRVYPSKGRLYFLVFIWRSLRDFRAACPGNGRALGLCRGYDLITVKPNGANGHLEPDMGEIHLVKRYLTMGIITHESTHAAFRWSERARCHPALERKHKPRQAHVIASNDPEERFCYALGNIAKQIAWGLNKRKII